jgi:hypothetical protein
MPFAHAALDPLFDASRAPQSKKRPASPGAWFETLKAMLSP